MLMSMFCVRLISYGNQYKQYTQSNMRWHHWDITKFTYKHVVIQTVNTDN